MLKSRLLMRFQSAGHTTAVLRSLAYTSPSARLKDLTSGIEFYRVVARITEHFEEEKEDLIRKLKSLAVRLFRTEGMMISYTASREGLDGLEDLVDSMKKRLFTDSVEEAVCILHCEKKNEGFKTASKVQYVARSGNFIDGGAQYSGALQILKVILSYDYLWQNIRVKGGAYGCMSGFKRSGESFFVSYRDPHLRRTLDVFKGIPEYVRSFKADEREMTKYIIGTISGKDVPRTPKMQGAISRSAWFCGITEEMAQKERDEILKASETDIQELAPLIEAILDNDAVCVVGSEPAIEKEKELFDTVLPLISC